MGLVCGVLERDPSTRGTSLRLLQAQGAAGKEPGTAGEGAGTGGLAPGRCPPADPLPPAWPRRCGCGHRCGGGRLPDGRGAPAPYQPPRGAGKAPCPAVLHPALLPHSAAEPGGSQQELTYLLLAAAASSARLRSRPPPCCSGPWLCTAPPDPPRGSPVPPEHGKELQVPAGPPGPQGPRTQRWVVGQGSRHTPVTGTPLEWGRAPTPQRALGTVAPMPAVPCSLPHRSRDESRQLAQEADPQRLPGNVSIFHSSAPFKSAQDGANHSNPPPLRPRAASGASPVHGRAVCRAPRCAGHRVPCEHGTPAHCSPLWSSK